MSADTPDEIFTDACRRLFELHASGYQRVRPARKTVPTRTERQQTPVAV